MPVLQGIDFSTISLALMILMALFAGLVGIAIQLLILRIAMVFPPIRALVRWILDAANN